MNRRKLRRKRILFSLLLLFSFIFGLFPGASRATDAEVRANDDVMVITENIEEEVAVDEEVLEEEKVVIEESVEEEEVSGENENLYENNNPVEEKQEENADVDQTTEVEENIEIQINNELEKDDSILEEDLNIEEKTEDKDIPDEIKEEYSPKVLSAVVGNVKIDISADVGILPDGTTLNVRALSNNENKDYVDKIKVETGTSLDHFNAFDITLFNKDGNEIQPDGDVTVNISGLEFVKGSSEVVAYHIGQNSKIANYGLNKVTDSLAISEITADGQVEEVTFETNHFSIYGVGTKATATYNFYVGTELKDTQIVLNGEKLKEPATPQKQIGKKFIGWYVQGQPNPINFNNNITVNITETINVEARFVQVFYVYFVYNGNIIKTKEVIPPATTTNANDVPLVILEDGKALLHWSTEVNGVEAFNFNTQITSDITLYAVLADRWTVTFDSRGGSPLLPKAIENGNPLGTINDPVRAGYNFQGWYTQPDGVGLNYTSLSTITSSVKLYAKWGAKTNTPYTVLYWQENPNDDDYTLKEVVQRTGTTASNATFATKNYTGFTLNATKTNAPVITIKGDGSSVKNVYYDRNKWKLEFKSNNGGTTYKTYTNIKQGEDTASWWNEAVAQYPNYLWATSPNGNTYYSLAPDMPNSNLIVYAKSSSGTNYTIYYWEEGTNQYVHPPYSFTYNGTLNLTQEDYVAFPGFTVKSTPNDGSQNRIKVSNNSYKWNIYYARNKYNITFQKNDLTGLTTITGIPYQQDISNKALAGYTVNVTTRVSDGFVFKGWYDNENTQGNPYTFTGKTMPAGDLILYAKWAPPSYTVKYYETQAGVGTPKETVNIPSGDTVAENQLTKINPGLPASDFLGWYWYLDGTFIPYDFDTPVINNNYVLYPVWKDSIYNVTYEAGGGNGTPPIDANNYKINAAANVLSPTGLSSPTGTDKVFIGWRNLADPTSIIYYPNNKLIITGDVTLTAQWGDLVPETTLTYKANGGVGADDVISGLKNNDKHVVKQNTFTRAGYTFLNWKDEQTGITYLPGVEVTVGNGNPMPNVLLAQWEKIKIDITGTKVWVGGFAQKPTIELQLYRNGIALGAPITLLNSVTQYTWVAYDKTDDLGVDYVYTVKEVGTPAFHSKVETGLQVTNTHSVGQVDVKKVVTGNLGDKSKYFEVDVTFKLPEGKTMGISNSITYMGGKYLTTQTVNDNSQNTFTVTIEVKHGDTVTFSNIPYGLTYTVQEKDYSDEGYVVSYEKADDEINSAKDTVTITNYKEVVIDAGVSVDSLPYFLILAVIGLGSVIGLTSKRKRTKFN